MLNVADTPVPHDPRVINVQTVGPSVRPEWRYPNLYQPLREPLPFYDFLSEPAPLRLGDYLVGEMEHREGITVLNTTTGAAYGINLEGVLFDPSGRPVSPEETQAVRDAFDAGIAG